MQFGVLLRIVIVWMGGIVRKALVCIYLSDDRAFRIQLFVRSFIRSSVCRPFIVYIDWNEIFNVNLGQGTQKGAENNNNTNEIKSSITKRKNSVSKKCITICVGKMQRKIFRCQRVP